MGVNNLSIKDDISDDIYLCNNMSSHGFMMSVIRILVLKELDGKLISFYFIFTLFIVNLFSLHT